VVDQNEPKKPGFFGKAGLLRLAAFMPIRGIIFDLDGTLVDSQLDFDQIRRDLHLSSGTPILEAVEAMPAGRHKDRSLAILREHEMRGARRATLMPGAAEFLADTKDRGIEQGLLTRNSRESTQLVLDRLGLNFSQVVTRDDAPVKPEPDGLLQISAAWRISVDEILFVGDYLFDLEAGRRAGIRTVLYLRDGTPEYADIADFTIRNFAEVHGILGQRDDTT